jgi:phosphatidylserine decarboxylase
MTNTIEKTTQHFGRLGGMLPEKPHAIRDWIIILKKSSQVRHSPLTKVMVNFKKLIASDAIVRKQLNMMIEQVPWWFSKIHDDTFQNAYLRSVDEMIVLINDVLDTAPEFNNTELVGCPINAILDWTMATPAGCAAFCNPKITAAFKEILDYWKRFLSSPYSRYVLSKEFESKHEVGVIKKGWMCEEAQEKLHMDDYVHEKDAPHWGFRSWNDFFTRRLKAGARKIDHKDDNRVIVSSADSTVFQISHNVKEVARFWIKKQPYSLREMLNFNPNHKRFIGGDVYQAFLCAYDYHRWHSPIKGTVVDTEIVQGTYYAEAESEGFDPGGPDLSQGFIAHVATRAIVYIEAEDPKIGLMAAIYIGMAEISSCVFTDNVVVGGRLDKGDPLGYFQFGGSTHCLIFQKEANVEFNARVEDTFRVGNQIAVARG